MKAELSYVLRVKIVKALTNAGMIMIHEACQMKTAALILDSALEINLLR
jgi:hypothetical protein